MNVQSAAAAASIVVSSFSLTASQILIETINIISKLCKASYADIMIKTSIVRSHRDKAEAYICVLRIS